MVARDIQLVATFLSNKKNTIIPTQRSNKNSLNLPIESIVCRGLIDLKTHLLEPGDFHDPSAYITVHIVIAEVGDNLTESYDFLISRHILCKVIAIQFDLLIRGRLTTFHIESGTIAIAHEEIVMHKATQRGRRATRIGTYA